MQRTTIAQPVSFEGITLFSAQHTRVTITPNTAPSGIVFEIAAQTISAHIEALSLRPVHPVFAQLKPRCTSVGNPTHTIATIEHILSALTGIGITDAIIRIDSEHPHAEIPILDGSAKPFVDAILTVGIKALATCIEPIRVQKTIRIEDGNTSIVIEPSDSVSYTYHLDYPDSPIASASVSWDGDRDAYIHDIAPARTFSLEHEAKQMQAAGLFTHLTTSDMLVIGPDGPIDNAFRLPSECARHKLLDLIGDLTLVGAPLLARVSATRSGHALAHEAARAILAQQESRAQ